MNTVKKGFKHKEYAIIIVVFSNNISIPIFVINDLSLNARKTPKLRNNFGFATVSE